MADSYKKGTWVEWDWGQGTAQGKVVESSTDRIERTIKGKKQSRNGEKDNPAYVLEQEDNTTVLKLHSELRKA